VKPKSVSKPAAAAASQKPTEADLSFKKFFKELVPLEATTQLKHAYTVELTRATFDKECFEVFKKYEAHIHKKDDKSKSSYERFLCQSPLYDPSVEKDSKWSPYESHVDDTRTRKDEGIFPEALGSYHMIHRIDGKVAFVGVLDFTAECISSVYLYYDPAYEFLQPGTLSALREIEYVQKMMEDTSGRIPDTFKWYYMGLYYQTCQKSVYKANFKPSEVACPHTWHYVPLTQEVKDKFEKEKKPKLSDREDPAYSITAREAKEKGLRAVLKFEDGRELNIMQLNKAG